MNRERPLSGKRIVLTRHIEGSSRMADRLSELGADILEIPLIEVRADLDKETAKEVFQDYASYEWLLFTSRNGVKHFMEAFMEIYDDIRSLGFIRIGAVGKGTVEALRTYFLKPDLIASEATAADLANSLQELQSLDNLKVLVVTGNRNREDLTKSLWENRAIVDNLRVYSTHFCDLAENPAAKNFRETGADAIVFASASAVQAFGEQAAHLALKKGASVPAVCSFGPTTSDGMKKAGIPIAVEAAHPGMDGMIDALVDFFSDKP